MPGAIIRKTDLALQLDITKGRVLDAADTAIEAAFRLYEAAVIAFRHS